LYFEFATNPDYKYYYYNRFYGRCTGQPVLAGIPPPPAKNFVAWKFCCLHAFAWQLARSD